MVWNDGDYFHEWKNILRTKNNQCDLQTHFTNRTGGMFALNIKQQLLNEQGEIKAVSEMVGLLHEPMQISFDYIIKSSDLKSLDDS